ncbi:hypothetical protein [Microbaculum marinum]|uniref:Uncharacterized protein n=1 Tax=Microbaculum marinum TaxID=1764581 RepID=A0AAW9RU41_9HYPH
MTVSDGWALGGTALGQFAGAFVNPLAWLVMIAAALLIAKGPRSRRIAGILIGLSCALPGAVMSESVFEAGTGVLGGAAGGLLLAEVTGTLVLPVLRLLAWCAVTAGDLVGFAAVRLGGRVRQPPGDPEREA